MSNASLKEQLQAVASQLSDKPFNDNSQNQSDNKPDKHFAHKPKSEQSPKKVVQRPVAKLIKPKPKWLDYAQYGIELLKTYFPACFKVPHEVKPLKKGIKQDLVMRLSTMDTIVTDDKACMVKSLAYYVNTASYHRSVVADATRIDLDGNPDGIVTAEEAKYSVDRQQAKIQAKNNAVQASQPQPDNEHKSQ